MPTQAPRPFTRTVQLELTLSVDISCAFANGAWRLVEIEGIRCGTGPNSNVLSYENFADYISDEHNETLADLFAQQEP